MDNHETMMKVNPGYVSTVFQCIAEGVKSDVYPFHLGMLVSMLEFYRMVDPHVFYSEMIKNNLVFVLLFNIDYKRCADFLIDITSFSDRCDLFTQSS